MTAMMTAAMMNWFTTLAIFSLDGDLREEVPEVKVWPRVMVFPITIPVRLVGIAAASSGRRKSVTTFESLSHPKRSLLLSVEGQVRRLVVVAELLRVALDFVDARVSKDSLWVRADAPVRHRLLRGHLLSRCLSLHLLPEQRDVLDALQLARVAEEPESAGIS
jgi:hypothetical protein